MKSLLLACTVLLSQARGLTIPPELSIDSGLAKRQVVTPCENTPTSRGCWGDYSIDTNYYDVTPDTGVVREYWLVAQNTTLAPDGYERHVLVFNGTYPGPLIEADWGDTLVIHVTNALEENGTTVHWHGIRQLGTVDQDGVPGVTQCPIAPGETLTYRFRATQYGHTWYHSHFTLQYNDGLLGPLIIHGPSTADYDEDLGVVILTDWGHTTAFDNWASAKFGPGHLPRLDNGLINGQNVYDCSGTDDPACLGTGKRFEATFVPGKKYLIRLLSTSVIGDFQFSIDNHSFTVISTDFVPIEPYTTDHLQIAIAQRYEVIVEANAAVDNYWLRATWQVNCGGSVADPDNILGIVRYEGVDNTNDPTTVKGDYPTFCGDEPLESLVPYLALDVGPSTPKEVYLASQLIENLYTWTINTTSLYLNWSNPTILEAYNDEDIFPTEYNVYPIVEPNQWVYWVIQDLSGQGVTHPIHLHGHDFWVLASELGTFDPETTALNVNNPPRRDVASLSAGGFIVMAFYSDNPGSWLLHCHIAWHQSQGLALQFVEREPEIAATLSARHSTVEDTCSAWRAFYPNEAIYLQDDSGI